MRGFLFFAAALLCTAPIVRADDDEKTEKLDSVVVSATRAGKQTPVTFTSVSKEELRSSSPMNSLPMALSLQPSVVTTNEGGTGLGYSKMTVRGSKGSQVNVTLNGITLNDSESQEVFWVNIPSLGSILSSVQLQRGLGTSSNGAGAFGASINMSTASVTADPHGCFDIARGSFNTMTTSASATTGLLPGGFYASAAYSKNTTDGYIRNAYADVQSAFVALGWLRGANSLRFTYLGGKQRSGITWNGISLADMESDRTYNGAGAYYDQFGNVHYYDNETDNYVQNHFQLNYTHQFDSPLVWSTTVNYTKGDGYYEQMKSGKKLTAYGLSSPVEIDGVSYKKGDFLIRKQMDNYYIVGKSDLRYVTDALTATGGVYVSSYHGGHFGNVLWSNLLGDMDPQHEWYNNNSVKNEFNVFARAEYNPISSITAYADLQYRGISLTMEGIDDEFSDLAYSKTYGFFNPRAGVTFHPSAAHKAYASVALGHREPGRSDIKEVIETINAGGTAPELKPEKMVDTEIGYEYTGKKFSASANIYLMEYWDMLLETGKISDSGYAIKENVPRSWRRGIELAAGYMPVERLRLEANATFSVNQILDYTAYYEMYDNMNDWGWLGQKELHFDKTTMLLSPSVVAMAKATYTMFDALVLDADVKYVGKQYWDNTGSEDRCIPGHVVANASIANSFKIGNEGSTLKLGLYVQNLLNNMYYADAWVYRAYFQQDDAWYQEEGVFPQAPINCMVRMTYTF